jgi:hypothetical protein
MKSTLLLIRPKHGGFTNDAHDAAELVKIHASNNNWDVIDKAGRNANKNQVLAALNGTIDLVIHYGHGEKDALFGQKKNKKEKIFDKTNIGQLLKNHQIPLATVSCLSALEFGPSAAPSPPGTNAYLGYNAEIAFPKHNSVFMNKFNEAYNKPNLLLLSGQTFQTALQQGKTFFLQKYQEIANTSGPNIDPREKFFALSYITLAHDALTLCGNGNTTAP